MVFSRKLKTTVFELYKVRYENITRLAQAMEMSVPHVYNVHRGDRGINEKFIVGAVKAFPEYKLDVLFYVEEVISHE